MMLFIEAAVAYFVGAIIVGRATYVWLANHPDEVREEVWGDAPLTWVFTLAWPIVVPLVAASPPFVVAYWLITRPTRRQRRERAREAAAQLAEQYDLPDPRPTDESR